MSADLLIFKVQWLTLKVFACSFFSCARDQAICQLLGYWVMRLFFDIHVSLTCFIWPWPYFEAFHCSRLIYFEFVSFSYIVSKRSTTFGVCNDFKVYMFDLKLSSDQLVVKVKVFACSYSVSRYQYWFILYFVCFSHIISNGQLHKMLNDCKVYMSDLKFSSDHGLIFKVHWSIFKFLFCLFSVFLRYLM